jgi:transposase InsO family protein
VSHRNAPLSELGRLRLARCVVDEGWPLRRAAERFQVSPTTAARWAGRYRRLGAAGMADRSSRPQRSPRRTPTRTERRIIKGPGVAAVGAGADRLPARAASLDGAPVLARYRLARLAWLDRATGRVVRRYERDRPGELVHLDIKKLGKFPDGGGWRMLGREGRSRSNRTRPGAPHNKYGNPIIGYHYLHTAIDDHSRLAYSELLPDETGDTAAAFWLRARAWFASCGITVERVLTDNGACYRSRVFADALGPAVHKRTRPYRPQTNGKVERFNRTLLEEWAYARLYRTDVERCDTFPTWLHTYNHHRGHTALAGLPPASRVPNLSGQNT